MLMKKSNSCFKLLLVSFLPFMMFAQTNGIKTGADTKSWEIYTQSSVYRLKVDKKEVLNVVYYGTKYEPENKEIKDWEYWGHEVPVRGGFVVNKPILEVVFADGVRDIELEYKSYEIVKEEGYEVLRITQKDKYYPIEVVSCIRVLPEYDLMEKWTEILNKDKKAVVKIENMLSSSVFLPADAYDLTQFSGVWGHELTAQTAKLTQGTKTVEARDFKPHGSSSFMLRPQGETDFYSGKVWFGSLVYGGNWKVDFDKAFFGRVQILGGINFWDQELNLKPQQTFVTPRMLYGYTERGSNGATQNLVSYTKDKLQPKNNAERIRPVLYNSWYATTFNVNEEHQLALAKVAKDLGAEMFVIDDGWFKGRVDESAGLGDWTVDKKKFPNGLGSLISKINEMGLDFGLWIEPEMVNPNSDLYRAHPDWVFHFNNRTRHLGRGQLTLNLAREDVYQYLYKCLHDLLKENNIKYIKWDMNKPLTDPGFTSAPVAEQRAVRLGYVENLYRLIETLRKDFPDVWFENCSSGGGRIDLAMLARYDFNWVSDNTDPVERIFLQDSYLTLFPANTMISWVTEEDWHKQGHSLEFKFDVSMAGLLGVGYDITKWTDEQKAIAKNKIAEYKQIREVVQKGITYRIVSPFNENRSVLQYVSKDKKEAVVFVYDLAEYPKESIPQNQKNKAVRLRGLDLDVNYTIEGFAETMTGKQLMEAGVTFPLKGAYKSKIYKIKSIN